jgi:DNA-directed RNA polymerase subunit RPC12/RpoP
MPIPVSCVCGRQFKVPDEYAGRKIKCPACTGALSVTTAPEAPRPVEASTMPLPGMVVFACGCGKQMQAKVQYAGRSVRCPACGAAVTVPGGEAEAAAVQAEPPPPARRRRP